MAGLTVGIIGMGDMGKMYARRISAAGWRYVASRFFGLSSLLMPVVSNAFSLTKYNDDLSAFGSSMGVS